MTDGPTLPLGGEDMDRTMPPWKVVDWIAGKEYQHYVYAVGPIDHWVGWMSGKQLRKALRRERLVESKPHSIHAVVLMESLFRKAFVTAGWEGDGTVCYTVLPRPDYCDTVVIGAVKQGNNGSVFIASQVALLFLDDAPAVRPFK
jgi:hypothetical protein